MFLGWSLKKGSTVVTLMSEPVCVKGTVTPIWLLFSFQAPHGRRYAVASQRHPTWWQACVLTETTVSASAQRQSLGLGNTVCQCRPTESPVSVGVGSTESPVSVSVGSTGSPVSVGVGSTGSPVSVGVGSTESPVSVGVGSTGSPVSVGVGSTGNPVSVGVGSTGSPVSVSVLSTGSPVSVGVGSTGSPVSMGIGRTGSPVSVGVGSTVCQCRPTETQREVGGRWSMLWNVNTYIMVCCMDYGELLWLVEKWKGQYMCVCRCWSVCC